MMAHVAQNVEPGELAALARNLDRAQFTASFGHEKLALVGIENHEPELHEHLLACVHGDRRTWYPRNESTGTGTALAVGVSAPEVQAQLSTLPAPFDGGELQRVLASRHYVMPVRKRDHEPWVRSDPELITVGRSRNNDIVLYDPSVSKVHAFLEHDDRDRLYVADQGSTNFTRVRGRIIEADQTVNFALGDPVQFGDVVLRIIGPETLWDALNGG
ncbi:MAG: FHA domain-containing protein [Myxococcota bacterium]